MHFRRLQNRMFQSYNVFMFQLQHEYHLNICRHWNGLHRKALLPLLGLYFSNHTKGSAAQWLHKIIDIPHISGGGHRFSTPFRRFLFFGHGKSPVNYSRQQTHPSMSHRNTEASLGNQLGKLHEFSQANWIRSMNPPPVVVSFGISIS